MTIRDTDVFVLRRILRDTLEIVDFEKASAGYEFLKVEPPFHCSWARTTFDNDQYLKLLLMNFV